MNRQFYEWCLNRARSRLCDPQYMPNITARMLTEQLDFQTALEAEAHAVAQRVVRAQAGSLAERRRSRPVDAIARTRLASVADD